MNTETFALKPLGYVRQWVLAGPNLTPYTGPHGEENVLRREALDQHITEAPKNVALGEKGPWEKPWRFHYPGENFFVEITDFYHCLTLVDAYAGTEIVAEKDGEVPALFWVAGAADLWVNSAHVTRFSPYRYMYPDAEAVKLPLKAGVNTLAVRVQCLGVRDTRILFGLQVTEGAEGLAVQIPGEKEAQGTLVTAANWLDGVRTEGREALVSTQPAPAGVTVNVPDKASLRWPEGQTRLSLKTIRPFQISVAVTAAGQSFKRQLEIPANRIPSVLPSPEIDHRRAIVERIATQTIPGLGAIHGCQGIPSLTARRVLGRTHADDAAAMEAVIRSIDQRQDCADFGLAMLLRLHILGLATPEESAEIKRAALAFRYWSDDPGTDAMCFWSENHSLLFHGCERIAGLTWPDEIFSNTGFTGAKHAEIALGRIRKWLDHTEPRGFDEFLSTTYMPITVTALLNVVDFAGETEVSRRAAGLIDMIYRDVATHAFQGVTVGPQGRVYRDVLYPEKSGNQTLLAYATPEAVSEAYVKETTARVGEWTVFLATSPTYRPPEDLTELMRQPVSKRSRQADVEIVLHKTADYLLTSLAVPAPFKNDKGEPAGLQPGWGGYQQHIWQATLGPGCHVFVNHPGGSFDESKSRPGYWYGNGILPSLVQDKGELREVFSIPDGSKPYARRSTAEWLWPIGGCPVPYDLHPMPFTHAHWPADAFDEQEVRKHWAFGRKGNGYIALWCSAKLEPVNDVLTGRELRAWAHECTWVAICGSASQDGTFAEFRERCLTREMGCERH